MKRCNKVGLRSGRLLVISDAGMKIKGSKQRHFFMCKCDCGNVIEVVSDNILKTQSCGCIKKEFMSGLNLSHGEARKTVEYKTWSAIRDKCRNPNNKKWDIYGGRGISVCERWENSYSLFLEDMGRRPTDCNSIDRIDVNGNYEPGNCRWSNPTQQANNTRRNVFISYKDKTLTLKQWSDVLGYNYKSFHDQYKYKGKTIEQLAHGRF